MRNVQIVIGSLTVALIASMSTAQAEHWIKAGTNPVLGDKFSSCVDTDSVRTSPDGWTSYRWKLCAVSRDIFETAVKCNSDFSAEKFVTRTRAVVANGKPVRSDPWKSELTYVGSQSGQQARLICHK